MVAVIKNFINNMLCHFLIHICLNVVNPDFVQLWDQQADSLSRFRSTTDIRNDKTVKNGLIFPISLPTYPIKNTGQTPVANITLINYE